MICTHPDKPAARNVVWVSAGTPGWGKASNNVNSGQTNRKIRNEGVSEMIFFKSCPRCKGDMVMSTDLYGKYMECLQCGHETEPVAEAGQENRPLYSKTVDASKVEAA